MHVCCSPHVQMDVESAKTAKEVWDILQHEYKVTGIITQIYLHWKFYTVQMAEDNDFDIHHQKLQKIYQDLQVARDALPESEFLKVLLMSLPSTWDNFITSIDFRDLSADEKAKKLQFI